MGKKLSDERVKEMKDYLGYNKDRRHYRQPQNFKIPTKYGYCLYQEVYYKNFKASITDIRDHIQACSAEKQEPTYIAIVSLFLVLSC